MSGPTKRDANEAFTERDLATPSHNRKRRKHAAEERLAEVEVGLEPIQMTVPAHVATSGESSAAVPPGAKSTLHSANAHDRGRKKDTQSKPGGVNGDATGVSKVTKRSTAFKNLVDTGKREAKATGPAEEPHVPESSATHSKQKRKKNKVAYLGSHAVVKAKTKEVSKGKGKNVDRTKHPNSPRWRLSSSSSGIFIDQDPILAGRDQHIILLTMTSVQIYSASTSLLIRSLQITDDDLVTSCHLSPSEPNHLFVSTRGGVVSKWDWETAQKLAFWQCQPGMLRIMAVLSDSETMDHTKLLSIHCNEHESSRLLESTLAVKSTNPTEQRMLLSRKGSWSAGKALENGNVLVLCSGKQLTLGRLNSSTNEPKSGKQDYTWREVMVPEEVVSLDAQIRERPGSSANKPGMVDIVLGCVSGVIIMYEDILFRLVGKEKGVKDAEILSHRLHWHRQAVNSVKWSRDGNYLISGGNETVLVIWQLDTNQRQFLPHLSTPILNLTVSEAGSSYALRMADNSVMVLSTADLLPSANISGYAAALDRPGQLPTAVSPRNPDQLLTAVHADPLALHRQSQSGATLLQTFDIGSSRQIARQAIARNMTTALRIGPSGQNVVEPNVTHLAISHDGRWLITVDEWRPNHRDLEALYPANHGRAERAQKVETCLRFWKSNDEDQTWQLVSRVDEPHSTGLRSVLGLSTNPSKLEVSTIGSDGCLRTWSPMARYRDGVAVKDNSGESLYTWTCSHSSQLENASLPQHKDEKIWGALSYSGDGSVLAASWSWSSTAARSVHLVNARTGDLRSSLPNILTPGPAILAFSGTHLLSLSARFCIWNTVTSRTTFSISLKDKYLFGPGGYLAANPADGTFALAFNPKHLRESSDIAVFDVKDPARGPLHQGKVAGHVRALLPSVRAPGYVLVDSKARIRRLAPQGSMSASSTVNAAAREQITKSLDDIFGGRVSAHTENGEQESRDQQKLVLPAIENRVGTRSLDGILGSVASYKPLPVREMFERVASLFVRAPAVAA